MFFFLIMNNSVLFWLKYNLALYLPILKFFIILNYFIKSAPYRLFIPDLYLWFPHWRFSPPFVCKYVWFLLYNNWNCYKLLGIMLNYFSNPSECMYLKKINLNQEIWSNKSIKKKIIIIFFFLHCQPCHKWFNSYILFQGRYSWRVNRWSPQVLHGELPSDISWPQTIT